ncbi:hypothetical protein HID58_078512 [Brassica napus]|uniref:RING-type E3 ubiquitin transferase n=1 Tax=Brassica napus TaxID=3708 RepID=A0ABQ7YU88_BRANA|nr:hypothetical protein HID58_078512 [Brassica napus]
MARNRKDKDGGFGTDGLVAVAIDKDKSSQNSLKWAVDNLLQKGQTILLVHVKPRASSVSTNPSTNPNSSKTSQTNGDSSVIQCKDVLLEDSDVGKALVEYANQVIIEVLVVGASSKGGFLRFNKPTDIPVIITKNAPDFCTVYVITKGKLSTKRAASRTAPSVSPLRIEIQQNSSRPQYPRLPSPATTNTRAAERQSFESQRRSLDDQSESSRPPFTRRGLNGRSSYGDLSIPDPDISLFSSGRPSTERHSLSLFDNSDQNRTPPPRLSNFSDIDNGSFESMNYGQGSMDISSPPASSRDSFENERFSSASPGGEDVEAEMRRLKLELKQTMEMYSSACKEALTSKRKATELQRWKLEEERKYEEAKQAEEAALAIAEKEKAKSKAALEAAEAAQRIAEMESKKRISAEMKALKETEEKKKAVNALANADVRYRKYSIEEIEDATEYFDEKYKIGGGGYGPVYKSCPEGGCLVYEFMSNGSLEDRLFQQGDSPPLSWQTRFRIAAEIGTVLLYLHQTKPEPLVHRDLKPANILLDRNFVSKVADVGLARLVPPSVANTVTQYRMTSTAGTFCYIDPEYQQTGMLGVKSDIYSLGIMYLQMITGKPPMGLTRYIESALEKGNLKDVLDPSVSDWPVEDTTEFAKLALKCAEIRRKDRPDLSKVILPELNRLRARAEESSRSAVVINSPGPSPTVSQTSSPKL